MEILQVMQQLDPATIIVALSSLPWIAAMLMLAVGAATRTALDDKWEMRAGAAVRWAGVTIVPARRPADAVTPRAVRRDSRGSYSGSVMVTEFYPHAA